MLFSTLRPTHKLTIAAGIIIATQTACSSLPVAGPAALQSADFDRNIYASVGIGTSRLTPDAGNFPTLDVNDRVEPAGQITVGADISKTFSVELHSADLGSAGFSPRGTPDGSSSAGRYNYHMDGISALAYVGGDRGNKKRRGLNGYGRVGLVSMDNTATNNTLNYQREDGSGLLLGAGVEYAMASGLGVRAEVMATDQDVKYGQVGVTYRLGLGRGEPRVAAAKKPIPEALPEIKPAAFPPPPPPPPRVIMEKLPAITDVVNFASDSDTLSTGAKVILDEFAKQVAAFSSAKLSLTGHTDSTGPVTYNQSLSERRARAVKQYLTGKGISSATISSAAVGETNPADSNATADGRYTNRRVELSAGNLMRRKTVAQ